MAVGHKVTFEDAVEASLSESQKESIAFLQSCCVDLPLPTQVIGALHNSRISTNSIITCSLLDWRFLMFLLQFLIGNLLMTSKTRFWG